ncbi:MAG: AMP-binding protein [Sphingomonadaceae bacterium]|nr:AMP-binding protein [Sphingomonadaceae bacterium]
MRPDYREIREAASARPEEFWGQVANGLHWDRRWDKVLLHDADNPVGRWFVGGELNACFNCVDRHVQAGHGDHIALIYESPVTGTSEWLTFAVLQDQVARFAGALLAHNVQKGDRVLIYMPNSVHAVVAMLACARIGAIHSVVFGGFAAKELATRIDDAQPVLLVAASCGIEKGIVLPYQPVIDEALALASHKPLGLIYWQRAMGPAELDRADHYDWTAEITSAKPADCVSVAATDPLYILYTSGTTGRPKGIVRDTGGYLAALSWSMRGIYDCPPGETFWAASDVGWVVGHSYIVYGPLLNRNATVIFEGKPVGTPDAGIFWQLLAKHRVRSFFSAPTAIRAIKQADSEGRFAAGHDLSNLRAIFLAGERTDPESLRWVAQLTGKPVVDHWWQTETGWAICANPLGIEEHPLKAGSTSLPMPGWAIDCLDGEGQTVLPGQTGAIVAKLPLPPGAAPTLWNAPAAYEQAYLKRYRGYYLSGDAGYIDDDGYVFVMTRIDDVINVAGHRLSSSAIEEVLAAHPAIAECAVIGAADELKGQVPVGLVVLKAGVSIAVGDLQAELVANVRANIGPVAAFRQVYVVGQLPKTRSGKILRKTIRQIADGGDVIVPATIEDRSVLAPIYALFGRAA